MKELPENISKNRKGIIRLLIILIIFSAIIWFYIYNAKDYVIIRFDELGALAPNMPAYYNGFKIGKIVRIEPDTDFKHTLVRVNLIHKNMNLPQNTIVRVENFPDGTLYLQFMYPESPSLKTIKRGDMLEGIAPYSLEQFMLGQSLYGVTDVVSMHVIRVLKATELANHEMKEFFKNTSELIQENSKGITASVDNTAAMTESLAQMAENLNQASKKINNALDEKTLRDTTSNVKDSTSNVKDLTDNISKATKDMDKTMKKIDDTICHINAAARNLNSITSKLNKTLTKKLAGIKAKFGKSVNSGKCCN